VINQLIIGLFALSIVVVALIVSARLVWCVLQAIRIARYKFAVLSVVSIVILATLFIAIALVWFGYGIAHSKKDVWTDLRVILLTGLPFHGVSYALWRMGRHFQIQLESHAA
jgi:hypothetical protein